MGDHPQERFEWRGVSIDEAQSEQIEMNGPGQMSHSERLSRTEVNRQERDIAVAPAIDSRAKLLDRDQELRVRVAGGIVDHRVNSSTCRAPVKPALPAGREMLGSCVRRC